MRGRLTARLPRIGPTPITHLQPVAANAASESYTVSSFERGR